MPSQIDANDPFLILLTDALRAGPGSPQWHQAVSQLKLAGENVDEYKLLIEARESLESGKDYRSVRAGPGFTRKLLSGIDQQKPPGATSRFSLVSIIAAVAGLALVAVIAVSVYEFYPRTPVDDSAKAVAELASTYFPNELGAATFDNGIPPAWRAIGSLPLETTGGLKAAGAASVPTGDYAGGGIVLTEPVDAAKPLALAATLHVAQAAPELLPQVFIANDPTFSPDRATSAQELVWQLQGGAQKVFVGGRIAYQAKVNSKSPTHTIRILSKGDVSIVECDGQRLWSGRNELGDKPRYLGVRFIRTGSNPAADVAFTGVKVSVTNN